MVIEKYITENKASLAELKTSPQTIIQLKSGASTQPTHAALEKENAATTLWDRLEESREAAVDGIHLSPQSTPFTAQLHCSDGDGGAVTSRAATSPCTLPGSSLEKSKFIFFFFFPSNNVIYTLKLEQLFSGTVYTTFISGNVQDL